MPDLSNIDAPSILGDYSLPPGTLQRQVNIAVDAPVTAPDPPPITFTATVVGGKLAVTFSETVLDSIQLRSPSSWSLTLPVGAGAITITNVETAPNLGSMTVAYLTLVGEMVNGGVYGIALAAGSARSFDPALKRTNATSTVAWTGVGVAPTVTAFVATAANKIRVQFSKSVRQVNPANADDALNPANYVISSPSLAVFSVTSVLANLVELTTATQTPNTPYTWTISNIKDLAGNVVP